MPLDVSFSAIPVTDLTFLENYCEKEVHRMKIYVKLYLESVPSFIRKIDDAARLQDFDEMIRQLHSVKPKWAMMGMRDTLELGEKIVSKCQNREKNAFQFVPVLLNYTIRSVDELKECHQIFETEF